MLDQEKMIQRVRELCERDERIIAGAMYGSFAKGRGDEFSDIEFYLFFKDEVLEAMDRKAWVSQISPMYLFFVDEVGNWVAIFKNLVRGEFHFEKASEMSQVRHWKNNVWIPDAESMLIFDRTGELTEHLSDLVGTGPDRSDPSNVEQLCDRFLNWMLFGTNVLKRGERARGLELLWFVQRHLLWMARIAEDKTEHYPTPSKGLENDFSADSYKRFVCCTGSLKASSLESAYRASWAWGKELMSILSDRDGIEVRSELIDRIDHRIMDWFGPGEA